MLLSSVGSGMRRSCGLAFFFFAVGRGGVKLSLCAQGIPSKLTPYAQPFRSEQGMAFKCEGFVL